MAHKVKVKSEDFDQGDDSYKSKASSPTTPKRMTRSSSKRPANVAKLSDRSPNLHKKHKTAVKSAPVQDEKNESDEGDSTGEYTEGTEEDENGSHNRGTDDDDEKLVEKQLASVQKEQRQKAEMKKNELHLKQREENRRREQERFKRLAKHRKEKEQLKELEENNRLEQERLQLLEKQRKEKEAQEKKRLEEEQHRMKKVRQQQERIDMYNRVKERIDRERLEKEQKEAKEQHNRQLAEEQKAQKKDAAGKSLRQEEEDDDDEESGDEESDDEESGDEDSDEDSGDEDDGDEEDGDKYEEEEDEEDDDKSEEEEEDEDKDEQEDKNLVGANAPNPANPGNEELCACIRCIKSLAIGPLYSCDFTNNPDKCAQCTNRGRSCNPVPAFVHGATSRLLGLQKQHDATHPKLREALRKRIQAEAAAIDEQVRLEGSRRRKTQEDTYRAILFGQVGIKHNQEEIMKLLRELLSRGSGEGAGPVISGRVDRKKGRA